MTAAVAALVPRQRVQYVGVSGRRVGPCGRVLTVSRYGVRVRWDDGRVERVHPDDVRPLDRTC